MMNTVNGMIRIITMRPGSKISQTLQGFSYYDPCYVDYYFTIHLATTLVLGPRYLFCFLVLFTYYSYTRYHYRPWRYNCWNYWDGYYGWGCNPYTYSYWPGTCYSGYYNYYGEDTQIMDITTTTMAMVTMIIQRYLPRKSWIWIDQHFKKGPVRVYNPSPKVFTSKPGIMPSPPSKKVIRSADGDTTVKTSFKPERNSGRKELPGTVLKI